MEALRLIKTLNTTNIMELSSYLGQKIEIIVFPLSGEDNVDSELSVSQNRARLFTFIEQYSGHIEPWTRDELHER